jgi:hypothetical protein
MNWFERIKSHQELVEIRRRVMHLNEVEEDVPVEEGFVDSVRSSVGGALSSAGSAVSGEKESVSEVFDDRGQDARVSSSRKRSRDFGSLP